MSLSTIKFLDNFEKIFKNYVFRIISKNEKIIVEAFTGNDPLR